MEDLLKNGFSYQVPRKNVEISIWNVRGIDKRTTDKWIEVLETNKFIEEVGKSVYEMNIAKVPHLVSILKQHPQTKIL